MPCRRGVSRRRALAADGRGGDWPQMNTDGRRSRQRDRDEPVTRRDADDTDRHGGAWRGADGRRSGCTQRDAGECGGIRGSFLLLFFPVSRLSPQLHLLRLCLFRRRPLGPVLRPPLSPPPVFSGSIWIDLCQSVFICVSLGFPVLGPSPQISAWGRESCWRVRSGARAGPTGGSRRGP